jgi:transposase
MVAAIGAGDVFSKGRDFAAWLGLVPKQISTGDRTILGKISTRGNRYLRVLFVQAAWVVLIKSNIHLNKMHADLLIRTMRLMQIKLNCVGIAIFHWLILIVKSSLRKSSN